MRESEISMGDPDRAELHLADKESHAQAVGDLS